MNACKICGHSLKANARFCPACGNSVVQIDALYGTEVVACTRCGYSVNVSARFCPACGSTLEEAQEEPDAVFVNAIIESLEAIQAPYGTAILIEVPGGRKNRRAELKSDKTGRFSPNDRLAFENLLSELIYADSFLYSNVIVNNESSHCVWHAISGGIFPLESTHAEFTLFYFDSLRPSGLNEVPDGSVADAPSIWKIV
jgi:RNA polymerase subunit RPABC4/transcription elongation factor Spt4